MASLDMKVRGKRPQFFTEPGIDEAISMSLELASELWTVRERMYAMEQVLAELHPDLSARIEAWRPTGQQEARLQQGRQQLIRSVLRALEARHVSSATMRHTLERAAADECGTVAETDIFRAA